MMTTTGEQKQKKKKKRRSRESKREWTTRSVSHGQQSTILLVVGIGLWIIV